MAVVYAGNDAAAEETVAAIEADGGTARAWRCDVANAEECAAVCKGDLSTELGPVAVLVNNAGIVRDKLIGRISDEDFDRVLAVGNLKGAFNMTKALPHVAQEQG